MATYYLYAYAIDGRRIAILQRGTVTQSYSPDSPTTEDWWLTPTADVTDGFMLEYTCTLTAPTTEASIIDANPSLSLAIVDYVKYRMAQDEEQPNKQKIDYWYGEFKRRIAENQENKIGGIMQAIPSGMGVLREYR